MSTINTRVLLLDEIEELDVLSICAHPDDAEIYCGGTLAKLARKGYKVGMCELTDGEPTPLNDNPERRLQEAKRAARTLGVHYRVVLPLPNRKLFDNFDARIEAARIIREKHPKIVFSVSGSTPMASPDHYQAKFIIEGAVFYARLSKWERYFNGLHVWRVNKLVWFPMEWGIMPNFKDALAVDISDTLSLKMSAIQQFESQFPKTDARKQGFLKRIELRNRYWGTLAGSEAVELCKNTREPLIPKVDDLIEYLER